MYVIVLSLMVNLYCIIQIMQVPGLSGKKGDQVTCQILFSYNFNFNRAHCFTMVGFLFFAVLPQGERGLSGSDGQRGEKGEPGLRGEKVSN